MDILQDNTYTATQTGVWLQAEKAYIGTTASTLWGLDCHACQTGNWSCAETKMKYPHHRLRHLIPDSKII